MSDDHAGSTTDDALDPLDAELRSLIAERQMDEILANLPCGNTTISAGGITCSYFSPEEEADAESEALG